MKFCHYINDTLLSDIYAYDRTFGLPDFFYFWDTLNACKAFRSLAGPWAPYPFAGHLQTLQTSLILFKLLLDNFLAFNILWGSRVNMPLYWLFVRIKTGKSEERIGSPTSIGYVFMSKEYVYPSAFCFRAGFFSISSAGIGQKYRWAVTQIKILTKSKKKGQCQFAKEKAKEVRFSQKTGSRG